MSADGFEFDLNPNIEDDIKRDLDAKTQTVVAAVVQQHAGKSQADIREALDGGLSEIGIPLPATILDDWATSIARGESVTVDITLA